ncbi:MAG: hypothetical protein FJZ11_05775 [Candidatus Omnitrophica bacterium]|nr:hypothetical protein [Candidatus Omnitrophota bacterium]
MAIKLNPFNAEYFAEVGNFLFRQSNITKDEDKILWLKRAEKLYQRACQLNPRYAEYSLLLIGAQIRIDRNRINELINNYRQAIEKDPYNLRNNYLIGINMLRVWDSLDEAQREFCLQRLKYVLNLQPWYGTSFYPLVLSYAKDFNLVQEITPKNFLAYKMLYSFIEKNNLWGYRKQVEALIDFYQEKERPQEFKRKKQERLKLLLKLRSLAGTQTEIGWFGKSKDGGKDYEQGNMYWTGTAYKLIDLPVGEAVIKIQARGDWADDIWPYMIVELDGKEIGEMFVENREWNEYSFAVDTEGGPKVLSVTFVNDGASKEKNEDRNLFVGNTTVGIK